MLVPSNALSDWIFQLYTLGARNFLLNNITVSGIPSSFPPKAHISRVTPSPCLKEGMLTPKSTQPINRGPHKVEPDITLEGQYINDYNWRMKQMFNQFTSAHDDISVLLFDLGTLYSQVLDNPAAYPQTANIKNTTGSCAAYEPNDKDVPSMDYKDPSCPYAVNEYFWLNGLHPTSSVHEVHAAQVALALAYNS